MKRIRYLIFSMFALTLIFTSCSTEETKVNTDDSETVQVTFGALLNSFNEQNKQADAECRDGVEPAYVMLGGSTNMNAEMGTYDLYKVGLINNNGSWETAYSEDLALPAGTYYLLHFAVYDANDQVLWVAPREGGAFETEVDDALPLRVDLVAGTKPYIDVDVLCYYAREEAAYGYPFFDFDVIEVENSYCIFVNYCDDGTGREYPAYFQVEVWSDEYDGTPVVLSNNTNTITQATTGWPAASVLCIALPDLGDDTFYARVTVLNHPDLDYTADPSDVHQFTFTQADIDGQELFIPAYNHIRINCGGGPGDVCDTNVRCELNLENPLSENCKFTYLEDSEEGWVRIDSATDIDLLALIGMDEVELGAVDASLINNDEIRLILDTPYGDSDRMSAYAVEVRPNSGGAMNTTCWETQCANVVNEYGEISMTFDGFNYSYPFYIKVETINCYDL